VLKRCQVTVIFAPNRCAGIEIQNVLVSYTCDANAPLGDRRVDCPGCYSPPGDLAAEQATEVKLLVNLKTAKELGITIPATIFARADEVVE
jgi:hypothetical protein